MAEPWGEIEQEPEVEQWLLSLSTAAIYHVAYYIDMLAEQGVHLGEPYTRQLDGKLRELRFFLGRDRHRISYYVASGRRIILLTVFAKDRRRERGEVERARRAMIRCIAEGHTAD
ncbi:MAG TPA: type II toxin-antitoxin system RelE/ParE family toxin [Dehalococcoidia bacterium]|nr:type II toxin-antitoxin system RelE/ParE family toxin [Dehalococcoidia bacterium]